MIDLQEQAVIDDTPVGDVQQLAVAAADPELDFKKATRIVAADFPVFAEYGLDRFLCGQVFVESFAERHRDQLRVHLNVGLLIPIVERLVQCGHHLVDKELHRIWQRSTNSGFKQRNRPELGG